MSWQLAVADSPPAIGNGSVYELLNLFGASNVNGAISRGLEGIWMLVLQLPMIWVIDVPDNMGDPAGRIMSDFLPQLSV
jgi:MFS-type transporter involved in bile tolerance (Atg22 family)